MPLPCHPLKFRVSLLSLPVPELVEFWNVVGFFHPLYVLQAVDMLQLPQGCPSPVDDSSKKSVYILVLDGLEAVARRDYFWESFPSPKKPKLYSKMLSTRVRSVWNFLT